MFIEIQRITKNGNNYAIAPAMVNVSNILFIEDDHVAKKNINEGKFIGLEEYKSDEFCTVTFKSGGEVSHMLALGSKYVVANKVREAKSATSSDSMFRGRKLLNG